MDRKSVILPVIFGLILLGSPAFADWPHLGVHLTQRFHSLQSDSPLQSKGEGYGQTKLNLEFGTSPVDGVDAWLLLEVAGAEEPEVSELYFDQSLPGSGVLRVGRFEVNYGNQRRGRTKNAAGRKNYLIGNHLVDPAVSQTGLELSGVYGRTGWSLSATSGGEAGSFEPGAGYAYTGKLWRKFFPGLEAAVSGFSVDNTSAGDTVVSAFSRNFYGAAVYSAAVADRKVQPLSGSAKLDAYQLDLTYFPAATEIPLEVYLNTGELQLPGQLVQYWSVEGRYDLDSATRVGLRHGNLESDAATEVSRFQLAVSRKLNKFTLAKVEYYRQRDESGCSGDRFDFEGVVGEMGLSWK